MDKKVLNALYNLGYLTSPVNEEKYKTIDDLVAAGYITIPGAKEKINTFISSMNKCNDNNDNAIETEETENEIVVQDTTEFEVENVVNDKTDIVEDSVEPETQSESLVETDTETTVTDEEIKEVEPKKRKSTKKVE